MSKRLVDSSILVSPDFIDLGLKERWLWLGLLLISDDYGWVNADSRFLKNRIAPSLRISTTFIERSLDLFESRSMIIQRTLGGSKCLQLLNFRFFNKLTRRRFSKFNELEKSREEREMKEKVCSKDQLKVLTRTAVANLEAGETINNFSKATEL
tara:strand:- start:20 stop:481 length:462 start_codon:yes stop_codon:yes gene_type:complete